MRSMREITGPSLPVVGRSPRPAPAAPPADQVEPLETLELTQSLVAAVGYKIHKAKAKMIRDWTGGLSDQPRVRLDRPLVCVQGFRSKPGGFTPLLDHLTAEGSGNGEHAYYVKDGRFYLEPECQNPLPEGATDPKARVFRVIPRHRLQSFEVTADQLAVEMAAIKSFTGQPKLDVLAHSMGGLSVRRYLDKHSDQMGRLMMLGTPHRGTRNAAFARKVIAHDIGWAMSLGGLTPFAGPAVELLRSLDEEPGANPFLEEMNQRAPQQLAQVEEAVTIGGQHFLTPRFGNVTGWGLGDALVERSALELPGVELKILSGRGTKVHHTLPTDDDVFQEMVSFYGWKQVE